MRKFLRKLLLFLCVCLIICVCLVAFDFTVVGNQYTQAYTGVILDKIQRLESIQEPKIILVGNSNLSYGIDSRILEEKLGMPVVNLGLHGGLGNAFHENMAKFGVQKGDIVVVCHTEYDNTSVLDPILACTTLEKHTELWKIPQKSDYGTILRGYPRYMLNAAKNWLLNKDVPEANNSYTRMAFNEYGDIIVRPDQDTKQYPFSEGSTSVPKISDDCVADLNAFAQYVGDRGAVMVVSYYAVAWGAFSPPEEDYLAFQKELKSQLRCDVISDIRDYFIPAEYFYDTIFHLNEEGTRIRTTQLAEDLQQWQDKNQNRPNAES